MPKNKIKSILLVIFITGMLLFTSCDNSYDSTTEEVDDIKNITIDDDAITNNDSSSDAIEVNVEESNQASNQGLEFVEQDYFYKDTVLIEIKSDKPCDIYFTLDGSDPDTSKELYQGKIELKSKVENAVYSVKAKGYYEDGTETDTIVHTYFVGKNINNRFDTLVFSVTSDPYNLYDYENGILVEGKLRDEFLKSNPHKWVEPPDPANFNIRGKESERDIYLEVIEPDGTVVISQKAGVRMYGGWSRANLQKSLKLFARKEYDEENNKFRYEFFPNKRAADGTSLRNFKRLVLRNAGNDNAHAFIRDELFQTLAGQAGFKDYHGVRSAALFINGDYRGHLWLHEVYEDEYFEEHYGDYTGHFEVLEGGETFKKTDEDEANKYAINDYEGAYSYSYEDLTDDAVYKKLRGVIDVENYLEYYAYQIHLLNEDWPNNNYKVYRYFAAEGEEYREAPFDGKWRYLLHDIDYTFGIYGTSPWTDNFKNYVSAAGKVNRESPLFSQLMQREDCKEYFVTRTLDFINGALSPDNLNKVLDEMNSSRMNEQLRMYGRNLIADWALPNQLPGRMEDIKNWGADRVRYTLGKYRVFFGLGEIYTLNVKPAIGTGVRINNIESFSEFEGSYYPDYDTVISAILPAGKELSHWLVNGEAVYDMELRIDSSYIIDDKVEATYVLKEKAENPKIFITEVYSDGDSDYIILSNPYKESVNLIGYSITDDKDEMGKLILPARFLGGESSLIIIGETNREAEVTGMVRAGFNLKEGETVALYLNGELVDEVTIPDLKKGSVYIRDLLTMKFSETKK
ncbi:MAG: CotH kinase family protein [Herbinix sp.]|nr:CotH kinase family protein [Herbinix sp.]